MALSSSLWALVNLICNQIRTYAAEGKTLLVTRHSLNALSEPRTSRTLEEEGN